MKYLNLKFIFFILIICIAASCSGHCDDEDLTRREKEANMAVLQHKDSLKVD